MLPKTLVFHKDYRQETVYKNLIEKVIVFTRCIRYLVQFRQRCLNETVLKTSLPSIDVINSCKSVNIDCGLHLMGVS